MSKLRKIYSYMFAAIAAMLFALPQNVAAQEMDSIRMQQPDSISMQMMRESEMLIDSLMNDSTSIEELTAPSGDSRAARKRMQSNEEQQIKTTNIFRPDPTRATWLAVIFPGGGQIYNRKYWKLPIVYGGFIGCLYAYNWNGQMYSDYRQAYLDIMDADPNTNSYEGFFRPGYDFEGNKEYLKDVFKKRKDRYRRWRDLSVFAFAGVYLLSIVDAYVDAQLSSFDITEDINLTISPDIQQYEDFSGVSLKNNYYGINCNITF